MSATTIEWTEQTWNPVVGCQYVHEGCRNCYAATMTRRLEAMGQKDYVGLTTANHFNGKVRCLPDRLDIPLRRRKPTEYFVNSMSDLFHPDVPFEFIDRVFAVMALTPRHRYMVLTKRAGRMREYFSWHDPALPIGRTDRPDLICHAAGKRWGIDLMDWPLQNVALGVSVSDQETADALIPDLLATPARWRFVSYEPALGDVNFIRALSEAAEDCIWSEAHQWGGECELCGGEGVREYNDAPEEWGEDCPSEVNHLIPCRGCAELELDKRIRVASKAGLHGIIFGGESGPGARPCNVAWARSTREQCKAAGVDFFCKQLGSKPYESAADGPAVRAWGDARIQINGEFVQIHLRDRKGGDEAAWPEDLRRCRRLPWREGRDV